MLSPQPTQPSDDDASPPMSPVSTTTSSSTVLDAKPVATRTRSKHPAPFVPSVKPVTKEVAALQDELKACVVCANKHYSTYTYGEKTAICWRCYKHLKCAAEGSRKIIPCKMPCGVDIAKSCSSCLVGRATKQNIITDFFNTAPLPMVTVKDSDLSIGKIIQCHLHSDRGTEPEIVKILLYSEDDKVFYGKIDSGHRGAKKVVVKRVKLKDSVEYQILSRLVVHHNSVSNYNAHPRTCFAGQYSYKDHEAILVVPYEGMDLRELIRDRGQPTVISCLRIIKCLLTEIQIIHELNIAHNDIFMRNICLRGPVNTATSVCLIDYGVGMFLDQDQNAQKFIRKDFSQFANMIRQLFPSGYNSNLLNLIDKFIQDNESEAFNYEEVFNTLDAEISSQTSYSYLQGPLFPVKRI